MEEQPEGREVQPQGMERRMVHHLLERWRNAREDDELPPLDDVMAQDLGDMVLNIYVLQVSGGPEEPEFERIGEALAGDLPDDLVGKPASAAPDGTLVKEALSYYARVVAKKVPITIGGDFVDGKDQTILYRSIITPLGDGGGNVGFLLGAANCKVKDA